MFAGTERHRQIQTLPLQSAVLCLDCEIISNSPCDECPACNCRSLVSLARILGGNLLRRKRDRVEGIDKLLDATITVELEAVKPHDLNETIDRLSRLMGSSIAEGAAIFHVDVEPSMEDSSERVA
jgi:hypothetical protein